MSRFAPVAIVALITGCASTAPIDKAAAEKPASGYAGTVQKVFNVVRQVEALPGIRLFGDLSNAVGSMLRSSVQTHQYVVRTPSGQIMAQSDAEFSVGDCVEVIPQDSAASGPAFRYGQARVVRSDACSS